MKVTFCGLRGTSVATGPEYRDFGGDTTSILIEGTGGDRIIIDAGTGISNAGRHLASQAGPSSLLLLLTHYHLDHLMGLPSLVQLHRRDFKVQIAGPTSNGLTVREVIDRILGKPFWPLQVDGMSAQFGFTDLAAESPAVPVRHGHLAIRYCRLHHPDGCLAYRVDEPASKGSLVFATDLEWAESSGAEKAALLDLCTGPTPADVLVMDGQFADDDYAPYRGWGHSRFEDAVSVARTAGVKRLYITHHAPEATDGLLVRREQALKSLMSTASLGRQNLALEIPN